MNLICDFFFSFHSASVNNLQAKVDALEKSNTKLTEEVCNTISVNLNVDAHIWDFIKCGSNSVSIVVSLLSAGTLFVKMLQQQ